MKLWDARLHLPYHVLRQLPSGVRSSPMLKAWPVLLVRAALFGALLHLASGAEATLFNVTFQDPTSTYATYYSRIISHIQAAGSTWAADLGYATAPSIDVRVGFDSSISTGNGASLSNRFVHPKGSYNVYEQGLAAKMFHGIDPNGSTPDVQFNIGVNPSNSYLNKLWFDPDPFSRTAPLDTSKTDAMSFFLHEFGHALGFNGWRNMADGSLPASYESTFDQWVTYDGSNLYFTGPRAEALYGGPLALTYGNIFHLGNFSPRPGQDLLPDLMNGLVFYDGHRYGVSPLDIAILRDAEVSLRPFPIVGRLSPGAVPEPATLAPVLSLALWARRACRRQLRER